MVKAGGKRKRATGTGANLNPHPRKGGGGSGRGSPRRAPGTPSVKNQTSLIFASSPASGGAYACGREGTPHAQTVPVGFTENITMGAAHRSRMTTALTPRPAKPPPPPYGGWGRFRVFTRATGYSRTLCFSHLPDLYLQMKMAARTTQSMVMAIQTPLICIFSHRART